MGSYQNVFVLFWKQRYWCFPRCFMIHIANVQIVSLNLFNFTLTQSDLRNTLKTALQPDRTLMALLMGLLDHNYSLVRAKALLTISLLGCLHPSWVLEACQLGLTSRKPRLPYDKDDEYVQRCLVALRHSFVQLLPTILAEVCVVCCVPLCHW